MAGYGVDIAAVVRKDNFWGTQFHPERSTKAGGAHSRQLPEARLTCWLIPASDLRNGRCVRLFKGDFAAETRYEFEPHELLQRYRGIGASWLHVVDLDGARDGTLANRSIVVGLASQTAVQDPGRRRRALGRCHR